MDALTYPVVVYWSTEDDCYIAYAPDLRGCSAHGETAAEALAEVVTAISLWLETARDIGKAIPAPSTLEQLSAIRLYREKAGLTQQQLSEKSGVNQRVLSRLELGQRQPTIDHLIALADALAVEPETLYPPLAKVTHRH